MMPSVFTGGDPWAASPTPVSGPLIGADPLSGEGTTPDASFAAMIAGVLRVAAPAPVADDAGRVPVVPGASLLPTVGMMPSPPSEPPAPGRPAIAVSAEPMVRGGVAWSQHAGRAPFPAVTEPARPIASMEVVAWEDPASCETPVVDPGTTLEDPAGASVAGEPMSGRHALADAAGLDPEQATGSVAIADPRGATPSEPSPASTGQPDRSPPPQGRPDLLRKDILQDEDSRPGSMPSGTLRRAMTRGLIAPGATERESTADRSEVGTAREGFRRMSTTSEAFPAAEREARPADEVSHASTATGLHSAPMAVNCIVGLAPSPTPAIQDDLPDIGERPIAADSPSSGYRPVVPGPDPGTSPGSVPSGPLGESSPRLPAARPFSGASESSGVAEGPSSPSRTAFVDGSEDAPSQTVGGRPEGLAPRTSNRPSRGPSQRVVAGSDEVRAGMNTLAPSMGRHGLAPIADPVVTLPAVAQVATGISQGTDVGGMVIAPATGSAVWFRGRRPSGPPQASSDVLSGESPPVIPPTRSPSGDSKMSRLQGVPTLGNVSPTAPRSPSAAGFPLEPSAVPEIAGLPELPEQPGGTPPRRSAGVAVIPTEEPGSAGWTAGGGGNPSRPWPGAFPVTAQASELRWPGERASTAPPTSDASDIRTAGLFSPPSAPVVRASESVPEVAGARADSRRIMALEPQASIVAPSVSPLESSAALSGERSQPPQRLAVRESPTRRPVADIHGPEAGQSTGSSFGGSSEDSMRRSGDAPDVPVAHGVSVAKVSEVEPLQDRILRSPRIEVSGPAWVSRSEDLVWDPHLVSRSGPLHVPSADFPGNEPVAISGALSSGGEWMSDARIPSADPTGMIHLRVPVSPSHGGDQNTARGADLPAEWSANLARIIPSPAEVAPSAPKTDGPGFRASGEEETPEKQGFPLVVPSLQDDSPGQGGRSGNSTGTPSASDRVAMDFNRPTAKSTTPASERSGGAVTSDAARTDATRTDASADIVPSRFHETVSTSLLQPVRTTEPESATPAPEAPGARTPTQRLQELFTGEAVLLQRLRNGSMTAVLRPEPGSEIRVELRRRQGAVEIRATVERGDTRAMAEGWPELQHQLRGQGILLHPLERESSSSAQRGIPDASGERSSNAGGRGRQQGSAQDPSAWPDGQPKSGSPSGSTRPGGPRTPASPRDSSRRLLESWA